MGWCSGTDIFDAVTKEVLSCSDIAEETQKRIIRRLIIAMEDHDWDCHQDAAYWYKPLVQSIARDLHPEWYEEA